MFLIDLLSVLIVNNLLSVDATIMCRNDRGHPVDWFIIYKPPILTNNDGLTLTYMDRRNVKWRKLESDVKQMTANPLVNTLNSIYRGKKGDNSMHAMYNDEVPDVGLNSKREDFRGIFGHTKGVISFDEESGYWLIHSVPKFPSNSSSAYDYPDTGIKFGQIFLCLSLKYKQLDVVGENLLYNHPHVYDFNLPQKFKSSNPNLTSALDGNHLDCPDLLVRRLRTVGGQSITGFAKSAAYNGDLWTGIAASLQTNLMIQSWRANLNSSCSTAYQVENVIGSRLLGYQFNGNQDHSKWGVSRRGRSNREFHDVIVFENNEDSPSWTCIGDINRATSQEVRGGGAVCLVHPVVTHNFRNIVRRKESCGQNYSIKIL